MIFSMALRLSLLGIPLTERDVSYSSI